MENFEVNSVEFGVCYDIGDDEEYCLVPTDANVKEALKEMLSSSRKYLLAQNEEIRVYQPSEKYGSMERVKISLNETILSKVKRLYDAENIPTLSGTIEIDRLGFYFCIFHDNQNNKLIAVRRATYFKGVIKKQLLSFVDDALRIFEDNVFKLDKDFDFLVCDDVVYILRPTNFAYIASLDSVILSQAVESVEHISEELDFVDFSTISEYVSKRTRAARLVASIRSSDNISGVSQEKLKSYCVETNVPFIEENDKIRPEEGSEMDFLKLLDRRLYHISLIDGVDENYEAESRRSR